jgi:hypothetical protein
MIMLLLSSPASKKTSRIPAKSAPRHYHRASSVMATASTHMGPERSCACLMASVGKVDDCVHSARHDTAPPICCTIYNAFEKVGITLQSGNNPFEDLHEPILLLLEHK